MQRVEVSNIDHRICSNTHFICPQNFPVIGKIWQCSWELVALILSCMGLLGSSEFICSLHFGSWILRWCRVRLNCFTTHALHRRSWHGITPTPFFFLSFCLHIYFQVHFYISLVFHLFFLILTCSCQYSCNLMLTATYMFRSYIY